MELKTIVAVTQDWGIGADGGMLCSLPEDMAFFRTQTKGAVVIMGRATLDSFPGGRPLKGRVNIVLTRDESFSREGVVVVHTVAQALSAAADAVVEKIAEGCCAPEVYVIGGEQVYRQLLPWCTMAWVTRMETLVPADRFFPDLDQEDGWRIDGQGEEMTSEKNGVKYRFCRYVNEKPLAVF